VPLEKEAEQQLRNVASLPIVYKWVAAMPDVHWGMGAMIGSMIKRWSHFMRQVCGKVKLELIS